MKKLVLIITILIITSCVNQSSSKLDDDIERSLQKIVSDWIFRI